MSYADYQARLGEKAVAQLHLNGLYQLWLVCGRHGVQLNHALRRAIFW